MKKGNILYVLLVFVGVAFSSCSHSTNKFSEENLAQNAILQQQDGTISLEVEKADTYHDVKNPESNTAEWSVLVSKSGRYDIWLSSATKDTTRLEFDNSVMLTVKDDLIEAHPSIDKVIHNSSDVSYPYFRADSFMGSLYIRDTGLYNIQVISDRILPEDEPAVHDSENATKILSVSLTPSD
ncbi:MAG TPA: hypothetical protein VK213_12860 [Bacteroidales bacterium]|nr:hypothetical protein [Bacteroidales bacterium]